VVVDAPQVVAVEGVKVPSRADVGFDSSSSRILRRRRLTTYEATLNRSPGRSLGDRPPDVALRTRVQPARARRRR
jgi:hypothetical protein